MWKEPSNEKLLFSCPICGIESYYFKKTIGTLKAILILSWNIQTECHSHENLKFYKYLQNMQVASSGWKQKMKLFVDFLFSHSSEGWDKHTAI